MKQQREQGYTKQDSKNANPFETWGLIRICQALQRREIKDKEIGLLFSRSKYLFDHLEERFSFDARGLATWIYQCSRNYKKFSKGLLKGELLDYWYKAAISKIEEFNSQGLSNCIYAFGILGIKPSNAFINTWYKAATEKIKEFNSQDLSNSIYAFGVLGIKPSTTFLNAWSSAATERVEGFNPQNLSNSIYAFGVLGVTA